MSNEEINLYCLSILERLGVQGFSYYYTNFQTLYLFGFRASELDLIPDWSVNQNDVVSCPTLKRGGIRTLQLANLPQNLQNYLTDQPNELLLPRYQTIEKTYQVVSPNVLTCGNKNIGSHIFRHNKMKQMYQSGRSLAFITNYFKLSSEEIVSNYINSTITKHTKPL